MTENNGPPARDNNFNILRLVFAFLVIFSHSTELQDGNRSRELLTILFNAMSFGDLAVDGFFLLSGYLIVQSWAAQPQIWPFLKKRVLRIYPAFIVATLVCVFVVGPLASIPYEYFSKFSTARLLSGLVSLQHPEVAPVFRGTHYALLDGAMWTIGYEFKCYLLVLLLGLTGAIRNRRAWLLVTVAIFGIASFYGFDDIASARDASLPHSAASVLLIQPRLACLFFVGGSFYLFREKIGFNGKGAFLMTAILLVSLLSLVLVLPALALAGGYLLFHFALKPISWLRRFNALPDISYGVYLYGWPIQKLFLWYVPSISPWVLFPLSCMSSIVLGTISWYVVEKPCMKLKGGGRRVSNIEAP